MVEHCLIPAYLAALAAAFLIPGPDMALVMTLAAGNGVRSGLAAALGIAAARFAHVMASGLGVAALLTDRPAMAHGVRLAGAAYLLWMAWKLCARPSASADNARVEASSATALRRGFFTNLLNPTALLFCGLLLPQFVEQERGPLLGQFVALGLVLVTVGLLFDAVYALGVGAMAKSLRAWRGMGRARNLLMAAVFSALALGMAWG